MIFALTNGDTSLQGVASWATILGFIFLVLVATISPWLASRRTEKKLGKPNGEGSSLFDVGSNAANEATAAKEVASTVATSIDENFMVIFNRLTQQDTAIAEIMKHVGPDDKKDLT
jgi:hypothetical protein